MSLPSGGQALVVAWTSLVVLAACILKGLAIVRALRSRPDDTAANPTGPHDEAEMGVGARAPARSVAGVAVAAMAAVGCGACAYRIFYPRGGAGSVEALGCLILGWGALSHLLFLLGAAGRLRPRWVTLLAAISVGAGIIAILVPGAPPPVWPSLDLTLQGALAGAFGCGILVMVLLSCFAPPRGFDAHAYHLELPRRYAEAGRLTYVPSMAHSPWPQAMHMLYVPGFLFRAPFYAQLTSYAMGLLLVGLVLAAGVAWAATAGALLGCLLLLMVGELVFQMADASVEPGLAAFTFGSISVFGAWLGSGDLPTLMLSACLAGFAASTKITGLLAIAALTAAALVFAPAGGEAWSVWRPAAFAVAACLVASPWYARAAWLTGNPVYHFATRIFPTRHWPRSSQDAHKAVAREGGWGGVRGLRALRYPVDEGLGNPTGWGAGILALAPLTLAVPLPRQAAVTAGLSFGVAALTLILTSQIRLLLGPAAGLALGGGVAFAAAGAAPAGLAWYPPALVVTLGALGLAGAFQISRHKLGVALRLRGTHGFMRRFLPYYDDFMWINQHAPADARLLLWTTRGHLLRREYIWLPPWQQGVLDFSAISSAGQFRDEVKRLGVTHVYYTEYEIHRKPFPYLYDLHEEMLRQGILVEEKRFAGERRLYRVT